MTLNADYANAVKITGPDPAAVLAEADKAITEKGQTLAAGKLVAQGLVEGNDKENHKAPCRFCDYEKVCGLAWKVAA